MPKHGRICWTCHSESMSVAECKWIADTFGIFAAGLLSMHCYEHMTRAEMEAAKICVDDDEVNARFAWRKMNA